MSEPIYEYVKGQGWIPTTGFIFTFHGCGTVVRIEQRTPKNGERFTWFHNMNDISWFIEPGRIDLGRIKRNWESDRWSYQSLFDENRDQTGCRVENVTFVVFVPV